MGLLMTQNELEYKDDHLIFNAKRNKALFMKLAMFRELLRNLLSVRMAMISFIEFS